MRRKSLAAVILAFTGLIGSMIWSFLPSPLPPPTPWSAALPVASPPPSMAIFQLPTGTYQTPAALAFRGGSFFETRDFASTAVLVRHPRWGDGSIALVPAPGHTPGSIVAFIALPTGKRYALIGDLTWQLEGVTARAERPLFMRVVADVDASEVRKSLLRIVALAGRMEIIPAHDGRAYADLPRCGFRKF